MSRPFRRTRGGVLVQLDAHERALLGRLLDDVDGLLAADADERDGVSSNASASLDDDLMAVLEAQLTPRPPSDPAVARLLPDGNREDPELAAGYRRLSEHGLRERKRAALGRASSALRRPAPVLLDTSEALALLKGLTDVRLVLGERLGLRTDEDAELLHDVVAAGPADPLAAAAALYDALTWWQESLVSALR
ncbi:MAG TPA: DUF2017 family protein [Kineosporiaceae bacterium]